MSQVIESMFNTISGKKIAMFGFAFKKDTGDTRETSSMYIARELLQERCLLTIQDEQVTTLSVLVARLSVLVTRLSTSHRALSFFTVSLSLSLPLARLYVSMCLSLSLSLYALSLLLYCAPVVVVCSVLLLRLSVVLSWLMTQRVVGPGEPHKGRRSSSVLGSAYHTRPGSAADHM